MSDPHAPGDSRLRQQNDANSRTVVLPWKRATRWLWLHLVAAEDRSVVESELTELYERWVELEGRATADRRFRREAWSAAWHFAGARLAARRTRTVIEKPTSPLRPVRGLGDSMRDFPRAARALRRQPGFVAVVVLTIGVGVGAAATVFGLANHLLLRPPPGVSNAGGVAFLAFRSADRPQVEAGISSVDFIEIERSATLLESLATYRGVNARVVASAARPLDVHGDAIYGDYFEILGVRAGAGRLLRSDETGQDSDPWVVVISEKLARESYGSPAEAVGRTLRVNDYDLTVIGVAGDGFRGTEGGWGIDFWVSRSAYATLSHDPDIYWTRSSRANQWFLVRPRAGVGLDAVETQIDQIRDRIVSSDPEAAYLGRLRTTLNPGLYPAPLTDRVRSLLGILGAGAGLLLLITCANVANLLLARGIHRRGDVAVSRALGASRGRVTGDRLIESFLLALAGTVVGIAFAWGMSRAFRGTMAFGTLEFDGFRLDVRTLAFAGVAVLATAILSGTLPAALAGRFDLTRALRDTSLQSTRRSGWLRYGMSVVQIGLSFTLLIGGLLMVRTVRNLYASNLGIEVEDVGVVTIRLVRRELYDGPEADAMHARMLDAVGRVPSVEAAALHTWTGPFRGAPREKIAAPLTPDTEAREARVNFVTPGWFDLFGVEALRGRTFRAGDEARSGRVPIVVTEALARRLFGTIDVVGSTARVGQAGLEDAEIVGVVGNVRLMEVDGPPDEGIFRARPVAGYSSSVTVLFRSESLRPETMAAVRVALESALPDHPVEMPIPLRERIDFLLTEQRILALLLGLFSTLALALAVVGLYGVMAFSAASRKREFGIRVALGADGPALGGMILRSAAWVVGLGVASGAVAAVALSRLMQTRVFGVAPVDWASYAAASGLLALVALVACWIPMRAAARTDPVATLRD